MENPIKEAVLSAYNEAVYHIAVKYSFVSRSETNEREILLPINKTDYLLKIFDEKAFDLNQVINNYLAHIYSYYVRQLSWRLYSVWPISVHDIEDAVKQINFANYDKKVFIFSPRNVEILTDKLTKLISAYTPEFIPREITNKSFVIDRDFEGTVVGLDRHLGEVHDHTLLTIFIFLLIVVILYLIATDNMLL